jgi:translation initiation factor IF-3
MFVLRLAQAVNSAIGRHWALHMQGFSVLWNRMLVAWHGISPRCSALFSVVGHDQRNNPGGPISTETRINERIRVPEVRLIGPGGEQVGIVRIEDALRVAVDADLDLVEVAPDAKPPVCKIMDYGKFKYETALKERESRKNQQQTVVKEQKLRPKIDPHDYETKKGHVVRFLEAGSKVKVTIMFRGREQSRPELGYRLLQKLGADVADYGFVETSAKQDGRNMTMVLAPHRGAKTKARAAHDAAAPPAQRASAAAAPAPAPAPAEAPTETPDSPPT